MLSVLGKANSVLVELNDIFVISSQREGFTSGLQTSDGCDVKHSWGEHTTRKVEVVSGPFPEVERGDQKVKVVS